MTYEEALEYIHAVSRAGSRPGLERIKKLCALAKNPQKKLCIVHVAGTNGKGSFCAMLSSVLQKAGQRVGTFTSPFVYRFNERIAVNGKPISDGELADIIGRLKPLCDSMEDTPTEFELLTAAGFLYFAEKACDVVVLEVGLGGRLDSTNVIDAPRLAVISGIALDHTAILGDTAEAIAAEKAGIIKPGSTVLCGVMTKGAEEVIRARAKAAGDDFYVMRPEDTKNASFSLDGCTFIYKDCAEPFTLSLCGTYQPANASLVIRAAELLNIDEKYIRSGLAAARWPARFEVLRRSPTVIFDGGHNPQGVDAAVKSAKAVSGGKYIILTGVMADKDYRTMARTVSKIAAQVVCTHPDNPRALNAEALAECYRSTGTAAHAESDVESAVKKAFALAKEKGLPLLCLGSLYMYRQVRDALDMCE